MFLILPSIETKTCFLIITDNVRDENIILNVFLNIFIVSYLRFEGNNVSVLISDPPLSPLKLQFCPVFCAGILTVLVLVFFSQFKCR